jgi:hypothetical protein
MKLPLALCAVAISAIAGPTWAQNASPSGNGASPPATAGAAMNTKTAPSGGAAGDLAQGRGEDQNDDLRLRSETKGYEQSGSGVAPPTPK